MAEAPLFAVGSLNPVKTACVEDAARMFWPEARILSVQTGSGVAAQPVSEAETAAGARHRALGALAAVGEAAFGVGIEGGVVDSAEGMWAFAWVCAAARDGRMGEGQTGRFLLPEGVARLIRERGLELGQACDAYFERMNAKQREGAIGLLSGGKVDRRELYRQGVVFALLRFGAGWRGGA